MDDGELYEFAEDWGEKTRYFVLTGFNDRKERLGLENKIQHLRGEVLYDVTWNDHITHVISKSFASTELVLGGKKKHFIRSTCMEGFFRACSWKMGPN